MAFSLSVLAYLTLVLLLAGGPFQYRPGRPGRYWGLAGPLASFLFLPNDSLPPFLDFAWSGPAFWLALLLEPLETLFHLFILILAWLFLCFYAFKRGLPGDLPGFSVLAATPLLSQAGPAGVLRLIGLFLALAPFAAARPEEGADPGRVITRLALSAFLITAFFPFNLSGLLEISAPPALGLDFGLFWAKVFLLNRFIAPRLVKVRRRFAALGGAAGLLLLTAEIYWPT